MDSIAAPVTMKAAQWDPKQNCAVVNTIPVPFPAPHQVLVKMANASLCRSDIIAIERPGRTDAFTLGHEGAGFVQNIGPAVPKDKIDFKEGDPIGFLYINGCCFECDGCMIHNLHCEAGTAAPVIAGFGGDFGFFAEYAVVDWQNEAGQAIAIVGAGGLGQLAAQYAKALDLVSMAIDINDASLDACKAQGATYTFNSMTDPDYITKVKALTRKNKGVDAVAVFSGANAAYASAPTLLRPGGVWMFVGIAGRPVEVSAFALTTGGYKIVAESTGIPQRMKPAVDLSAKHGIVPAADMRPGGLEEVNAMVEEMRAGKSHGRMGVGFD